MAVTIYTIVVQEKLSDPSVGKTEGGPFVCKSALQGPKMVGLGRRRLVHVKLTLEEDAHLQNCE